MTLSRLTTELRNPASEGIDGLTALEIVRLMNAEDATVAEAIGREAAAIARAIKTVVARLAAGGRLIYLGAGTSGRLGMLDAAECPPPSTARPGRYWASSPGDRPRCNAVSRGRRIPVRRPPRTSAKSR